MNQEQPNKPDVIDCHVLAVGLYQALLDMFKQEGKNIRGIEIQTTAAVFQNLPFYVYSHSGHRQLMEKIKAAQKPKKEKRFISERSKIRRAELGMGLICKDGKSLIPNFPSDIVEII